MKTITLLFLFLAFISTTYAEIKANYNNDRVEISWNNPKHIQIDYFVIERSKNGKYFKEILKVEGNDNQNGLVKYYEVDYNPFHKKAYYRIKQIDINGNRYYSNVILAKNFNSVRPIFKLFSRSKLKTLKDYNEENLLVVLINYNNKEFIVKVDIIKEEKELVVTYSNINIPTGKYIVTATSDDRIYGKK